MLWDITRIVPQQRIDLKRIKSMCHDSTVKEDLSIRHGSEVPVEIQLKHFGPNELVALVSEVYLSTFQMRCTPI